MDKTKIRFIRTWSFQNSKCLKYTLFDSYFNEVLEEEKLTHNSKKIMLYRKGVGAGNDCKVIQRGFLGKYVNS